MYLEKWPDYIFSSQLYIYCLHDEFNAMQPSKISTNYAYFAMYLMVNEGGYSLRLYTASWKFILLIGLVVMK